MRIKQFVCHIKRLTAKLNIYIVTFATSGTEVPRYKGYWPTSHSCSGLTNLVVLYQGSPSMWRIIHT